MGKGTKRENQPSGFESSQLGHDALADFGHPAMSR